MPGTRVHHSERNPPHRRAGVGITTVWGFSVVGPNLAHLHTRGNAMDEDGLAKGGG